MQLYKIKTNRSCLLPTNFPGVSWFLWVQFLMTPLSAESRPLASASQIIPDVTQFLKQSDSLCALSFLAVRFH